MKLEGLAPLQIILFENFSTTSLQIIKRKRNKFTDNQNEEKKAATYRSGAKEHRRKKKENQPQSSVQVKLCIHCSKAWDDLVLTLCVSNFISF